MVDVLSQDEINALIESYKTTGIQDVAVESVDRQIRLYDFSRPDRFSKDHLRGLNAIHAKHGALFAAGLGATIRLASQVELLALDQLTYREYCASVSGGTLFAEVALEPLTSIALFEFNPTFVSTCVELLAGASKAENAASPVITDVDCAIMRPVVEMALRKYVEAWSSAIELTPRIVNMVVESSSRQVMLPSEAVLVSGYEATIGETSSMISICVPASAVEAVLPALAMGGRSRGGHHDLDTTDPHLRRSFEQVSLCCNAVLGRTSISLQDVMEMEVGDLLRLPGRADGPVELWVENIPAFHAKLGSAGRNLGLRIEAPIVPEG